MIFISQYLQYFTPVHTTWLQHATQSQPKQLGRVSLLSENTVLILDLTAQLSFVCKDKEG